MPVWRQKLLARTGTGTRCAFCKSVLRDSRIVSRHMRVQAEGADEILKGNFDVLEPFAGMRNQTRSFRHLWEGSMVATSGYGSIEMDLNRLTEPLQEGLRLPMAMLRSLGLVAARPTASIPRVLDEC